LNIKETYQFTLLCKGDQVTHPKSRNHFARTQGDRMTNWLPLQTM